jgi:hypothetical protein
MERANPKAHPLVSGLGCEVRLVTAADVINKLQLFMENGKVQVPSFVTAAYVSPTSFTLTGDWTSVILPGHRFSLSNPGAKTVTVSGSSVASNVTTFAVFGDALASGAVTNVYWTREGSTVGYASVTANQGTFTAETDLTGLAVTVSVPSGRRVRITAKLALNSSVNSDAVVAYVKEGSAFIDQWTGTATFNNVDYTLVLTTVVAPSAGSHTYKLSAARSAGTGNITMKAASTYPAYIMAELV